MKMVNVVQIIYVINHVVGVIHTKFELTVLVMEAIKKEEYIGCHSNLNIIDVFIVL